MNDYIKLLPIEALKKEIELDFTNYIKLNDKLRRAEVILLTKKKILRDRLKEDKNGRC